MCGRLTDIETGRLSGGRSFLIHALPDFVQSKIIIIEANITGSSLDCSMYEANLWNKSSNIK